MARCQLRIIGYRISGSIIIVFDGLGNIGIAISGGGGGYAGIGGSGGIVIQGTDADNINLLNGPVVQTGGSGGPPGVGIGLEWVVQNSDGVTVNGFNFNAGPGLQGNGVTPFEFHSMLENTRVVRICPPWEIDWSDYPIPTSD